TGAKGYKIYRNGTLAKTIKDASVLSWGDTKATSNGTKYTYKIVAYAAAGDSKVYKEITIYRLSQPKIPSLTNSAAGKMTVKWGKNGKATGCQIQYSTSSKFTASTTKTVTIKSNTTVSKVIGSLTKGRTYYVRVRSYKTVSSVNYYSMWSAASKLKLTK
ncbi:MAG: fibronectin type III domain-containing protein, partial [Solobacterium sp.]|nr:fibronectin type III domain-containing protein [Solobacterium sp.]